MVENMINQLCQRYGQIKKGMSVVLDLGANIECSSKNLVDFSIMGALFINLFILKKILKLLY